MKFKKLESGRSMVEMLGVLAIIGVLSVGGIAGYSLSMRRHRANGVVDIASKYALSVYSLCQQKILNGELQGVGACAASSDIDLPFADAGLGNLPAGVTGIHSWQVIQNEATNVDSVNVYLDFSDEKLCQAVASIAGSSCAKNGTNYEVTVSIKQN